LGVLVHLKPFPFNTNGEGLTFLLGLTRIGPTIGAFLAVTIYTLMKRFKYWRLNVEQDTDKGSKSPDLFVQEKIEADTDKAHNQQRLLPSLGQITDIIRGHASSEEPRQETHQEAHQEAESSTRPQHPQGPDMV
jgi:hypothetical protein